MQESERGPNFVVGNVILAIALLMLFYMGTLWEYLGAGALVLWALVAGVGMYFVVSEKRNPNLPD